ncbi:hypothetical protein LO767_03805 [Halopseudomonas aestusnigri]|uniref:hypothetical protein n=1 Tax=Halopseudomonas aestusnigri TaxID=857252 RepID=UPI001E513372|nr:hypothetical protein [Halopseudomonas aestusnigri]UGV31638.1 hypothetical protein LO767_03805 [Halopseudomonas aestusnigri]
MKAEWDDAPIRVRKQNNHAGMVVSVVLTLGIFGGAAYLAESKGWIDLQPDQAIHAELQPQAVEVSAPKPIPQDDYDEQVNRLLRESAEVESGQGLSAKTEQQSASAPIRQAAQSDNGISPQDASLAILNAAPWGSGAQSQPQQETRRRSYVTVVEETKRSCWGAQEGSAVCRKIRQLTQQAERRNCEIGGSQHACERANRY